MTFISGDRENDALTDDQLIGEKEFIIGVGQPLKAFERLMQDVIRVCGSGADGADALLQIADGEVIIEFFHHRVGVHVVQLPFPQFNA